MPDSDATPPVGTRYDREGEPDEIAFTRASAAQYVTAQDASVEVMSTKTALALCMDVPFVVMTHEGPMRGDAGDYLLTRGGDDAWPVKAAIFKDTYRPA